jgi:hypothetical protein
LASSNKGCEPFLFQPCNKLNKIGQGYALIQDAFTSNQCREIQAWMQEGGDPEPIDFSRSDGKDPHRTFQSMQRSGQLSKTYQKIWTWGTVYSSTIGNNDQLLWLGTSHGLYSVNMKTSASMWEIKLMKSLPITSPVTSLLWVADPWAILFAGTESVFYEIEITIKDLKNIDRSSLSLGNEVSASVVYHEWIGGNLDSPVLSMHYDSYQDCLWVAERNAVHQRDVNQIWWRYGYKQGAITDDILAIASTYVPSLQKEEEMVGHLWIATKSHGLTRMKIPSDPRTAHSESRDRWDDWQLFDGPRYLLGPNISFIVSDTQSTQSSPLYASLTLDNKREQSSTLLVSTNGGISYLHTEPWTLSKKERALQTLQYPRHDRNGIVAEVSLAEYGDLSTYYHTPEDSDGIWTAQYAVASALRYSIR